ncbi:MAG: phage tail tape measure protein [Pseudomonadaceae bacterium]
MVRDLKLQVVLAAIDKATKPIKKIMGSSSGLAKSLKETRDTLKGLQAQQKDISSFRTLQGASDKTKRALDASKDKVARLARELQSTERPTRRLRDEFKRAQGQTKRLGESFGEQQRKLKSLETRLGDAGIKTNRLGAEELRLKRNMDRANQTLDRQNAQLKKVTRQQERLTRAKREFSKASAMGSRMGGVGMRGMAVGGAGLFGASRMLAPGISYGEQMSELQAITRLQKDDPRFQALKQQARGLGASTAFSATEVGAGQTFLARAGFTPEAIRSSMQDILNLALANKTDLARTADIASNISSAFKIDPEIEGNVTRVADVLSGTAARANVDLEMLGDTMKYLGGADDLKFSLEQAATMAGLMGNIGIQGTQAGTALRAMMNRLSAPVGKGADAIEELDIKIADAQGNMRDLPTILRDINDATREMGSVQRKAMLTHIFGAEAGSGMAELVGQMSGGGLDKLLEQLQNVQGENAGMAKTLADNIGGDLKGTRSAWEEIGISITEINEGPLRELVQNFTGILRATGEWINKNPELAGTIAKIVGYTLAFVAAMGTLTFVLASLIGPLAMIKFAMVMFAGVTWAATWPILAIIAAVALLATGAYLLYKHWDKVTAFFAQIWENIKLAFSGGIGNISKTLLDWSPLGIFYRIFAGVMNYFGHDLPGKFTEFGGMIIGGLVNGIKGAMGSVKSTITDAGEQTIGWFKQKLGIRSPSRVFAQLGDDTMAGLKVGLDRSQRGPLASILKAGKSLAGAGAIALGVGGGTPAFAVDNRPPLASGGSAVVVQGDTYHIQITAGPGSDPAQLRQMLNQLLDEREQGKAARIRAALHDNE